MRKLIWFIDGDKNLCEAVVSAARNADMPYDVEAINNPVVIDEKLKERFPQAIFIDRHIALQDNGSIVRDFFKTRDDMKQIPVVLMTVDIDGEDRAKEIGADGVLKKPFDIKQLFESATEHMKGKK